MKLTNFRKVFFAQNNLSRSYKTILKIAPFMQNLEGTWWLILFISLKQAINMNIPLHRKIFPHLTFSETEAKPLVGCCVLMSKTWNFPSRDVATNLFILMSFLSNSKLHTLKIENIYEWCSIIISKSFFQTK